ncbi:11052_t:CDS:2 [Gigaspora margarita]|uniref:11052_t:CDS:1 n=1 Tax=Gigaspora margarita TaxID=4874 RepID=A0ABN7VAH3_GIGMA|nr:11052_t:CDS:2 [Gigaspora margarita]
MRSALNTSDDFSVELSEFNGLIEQNEESDGFSVEQNEKLIFSCKKSKMIAKMPGSNVVPL